MITEGPVGELLTLETFNGLTWDAWTDNLRDLHIDRGGKQQGVTTSVEVGLLTATLVNAGDPLTDPSLHPNLPIRLMPDGATLASDAVYTGNLVDLDTAYGINKVTGAIDTFVTITACDAVKRHSDITVIGATSPAGHEGWDNRIARLAASATTPVDLPSDDPHTIWTQASAAGTEGWAAVGAVPANAALVSGGITRSGSSYLREISKSGAVTYLTYQPSIEKTFTGLTPGFWYDFTCEVKYINVPAVANLRAYVVGDPGGIAAAPVILSNAFQGMRFQFIATSTSHTIRIDHGPISGTTAGGAGYFTSFELRLGNLTEQVPPSVYELRDLSTEASLATHFDIANATVGAAWWTDRENVTQFRRAFATQAVKATFSDVPGAGLNEYIGIQASYDTRNLVNDLDLTNYGVGAGTGQGDTDYLVADAASVASWGDRPGGLEISLYTGLVNAFRGGINSAPNPSFENASATWGTDVGTGASARTLVTAAPVPHSGTQCLRWTAAAGDSNMRIAPDNAAGWLPAVAGNTYRFSCWLRSSTSRSAQLLIRFYTTATGGGTVTSFTSSAVATSTSAWTRYTFTATAPAGALSVAPFVLTTSNAAGNFHYLDDVFFGDITQQSSQDPYFTGDTTDTLAAAYEWAGTAHASPSWWRDFSLLAGRVDEIFDDFATPAVRISQVRWNAQEDPALAAQLDIQDRVAVAFRGDTQDSRIVGISHDIDKTRWMMTLDLVEL